MAPLPQVSPTIAHAAQRMPNELSEDAQTTCPAAQWERLPEVAIESHLANVTEGTTLQGDMARLFAVTALAEPLGWPKTWIADRARVTRRTAWRYWASDAWEAAVVALTKKSASKLLPKALRAVEMHIGAYQYEPARDLLRTYGVLSGEPRTTLTVNVGLATGLERAYAGTLSGIPQQYLTQADGGESVPNTGGSDEEVDADG